MKKIIILLIYLGIKISLCHGQKFDWVNNDFIPISTSQYAFSPTCIRHDQAGNIYSLLQFDGNISIQGNSISPLGSGLQSLLVKFNPEGNYVYSVPLATSGYSTPVDLEVDENNNIWINLIGHNCSLFLHPDTTLSISPGTLLIKLDDQGNFIRLFSITDINCYDGIFGNNMEVSGSNVYYETCAAGHGLIRRIDSVGNDNLFFEVSDVGVGSEAHIISIRTGTNGDLLVYGTFTGTISAGSISLTQFDQNTDYMGFLYRIDSHGNIIWGKRFSPPSDDYGGLGLAYDKKGNSYIGLQAFPNGVSNSFNFDNLTYAIAANNRNFLAKIDSSGNIVWYKTFDGDANSGCMIMDLYVNLQSEIIIPLRNFGITVNPFATYFASPLVNPMHYDILKLDSNGNKIWIRNFAEFDPSGLVGSCRISSTDGVVYHITGIMDPDTSRFDCLSPASTGEIFIAQFKDTTPVTPDVNFGYSTNNAEVYFSNTAAGANSFEWNFGDGQTSTQVNPSHTYGIGYFNACLTASNNCGIDQKCRSIGIAGLSKIEPSYAGNTGWSFLDLYGAKFVNGTIIKLSKAGYSNIIPDSLDVIDSSHIRLAFKFDNTPIGNRDIVADIPGHGIFTLTDGFEIQTLQPFNPSVEIVSPSRILLNSWNNISIAITNKSNETGFGVFVALSFSGHTEVKLQNGVYLNSIPQGILDSMPDSQFYLYKDTITGDSTWIGGFIIPMLRPGEIYYLNTLLKTAISGNVKIKGRVNPKGLYDGSLFNSTNNFNVATCDEVPPCIQCIINVAGILPIVGCFSSGFSVGCAILDLINQGISVSSVTNLAGNLASAIIQCGIPESKAIRIGFEVAAHFAGLASTANSILNGDLTSPCAGCGDDDDDDDDEGDVNGVTSFDPNIKEGPTGSNAQNFISNNSPIFYSISFENGDSATSPANQVLVTDQLDTSLFDLSTFQFKGFAIGDSTFENSIEQQSFVHDYDLRPSRNCILRTLFELNETTGLVSWRFTSLDPLTYGTLQDPIDGFLPPNVNSPEGIANVIYHLKLKPGLPHNTVISNEANITFDFNAPITTPAWINTIDLVKPQSNVLTLPAVTHDTIFTVKWSGSDADAGIRNYKVFVSDNDSAFFELKINKNVDSIKVIGRVGHKYEFFSIARDKTGNEEDAPVNPDLNPDAVTIIDTSGGVVGGCCVTLNLKLFIEGYYIGGGLMNNSGNGGCLYINNVSSNPSEADSVFISAIDKNNYYMIDKKPGILHTDGNVSVIFNSNVVPETEYYIKVTHRNSIETWSSSPVLMSHSTFYDFSTAQTKAYGGNMTNVGMLHSEPPIWAFYSGDCSHSVLGSGHQDGIIESQDYSDMENAVSVVLTGYVPEDITGDGIVESSDYSIIENNVYFVISSMHP